MKTSLYEFAVNGNGKIERKSGDFAFLKTIKQDMNVHIDILSDASTSLLAINEVADFFFGTIRSKLNGISLL